MPVPNIYEDTSATHGTGALSVPWGTHNDTFCAVLVVTCAGDGTLGTPTQSGADGTWSLIASCAEGSGAGSIQIAAYWCRATSGSMSNVDVPDTGDHTSAKMFMLQNVIGSGNPINMYATQTVATATASISMAAPSTTVNNCLVFCLAGCAFDQTTSPGGSGWANASLTSVGFGGQYCTNTGTGGGYMGGVGSKVTAGSCGTFSHTWASGATKQANIIFAISDTATATGSVGSVAGAATAAGVGASLAAAAGSAAGVAAASAVGADGAVGSAAGVATATAVGVALKTAAGTIAGAATAAATSDETLIFDSPGTQPGSATTGNWPIALMESGIWKFVWTPTSASGAAYSGFHALLSSGSSSGYGLWIVDSALAYYDTGDVERLNQSMTFSANQPITFIVNAVAHQITISGATTGNGTFSFAASTFWQAGTLWIGQWTTGQYTTAGSIGDIYGTYGAASAGAAAGVATATATGTAATPAVGTAAGVATASATGQTADGVRLGAYGSARQLFGASATSATATLNTTSGSAVLICTGGRLTDLATAPTDSHSNTWSAVGSPIEFHDWPDYGIRVWYCLNITGGTGHTFTQTMTIFDEVTIAVVEVIDGVFLQDYESAHPDNGQALTVPDVTITGPAYLVSFFCGDAVTGATTTITASNGYTVLDVSTFEDHPNGYVPIGIVGRAAADAGSYGTTYTESPDQGAALWNIAIQGTAVNSAGTAAGAATASGTGAATAQAVGAAAGAATAAAVAAADGVGTAAGSAAATAVGHALFAAAGAVAGAGAAAAAGSSAAASAGTVAGVAAAAATGSSSATSPGTSAGAATATATGQALAAAAGAATGTAAAAGAALSFAQAAGTSAGAATAEGATTHLAAAAGTSDATAAATAAGQSSADSAGSAAGAATATATGAANTASVGTAAGAASASAVGDGIATGSAVGTAAGAAAVTATGASSAAAVGAAAGVGAAAAIGGALAPAAGATSASSAATATGAAQAASAGAAAGTSTASATSDTASTGTSAGTSTAAAAGAATSAAVGTSAGTATSAAVSAGAGATLPRSFAVAVSQPGATTFTVTVAPAAYTVEVDP